MPPEPDLAAVQQRPRNLRLLVILLSVAFGQLALISGFEAVITEIAVRVRGHGLTGPTWRTALLCNGLALTFGVVAFPLWHGHRRSYKVTGILLAAMAVVGCAGMIGGGIDEPVMVLSMLAAMLLILFSTRLYFMPDVRAYVDYRTQNRPAQPLLCTRSI